MARRANKEPQQERIEPETFLGAHRRIEEADVRVQDGKHLHTAAVASAKSLGVDHKSYKLALALRKIGPDAAERLLRGTLVYW